MKDKTSTTVYFIQAGENGPIKIGFTRELIDRFDTLQVGNHLPLRLAATVAGGRDEERDLQVRFAPLLVRGEWYRPADELMDYISSLDRTVADGFMCARSGACVECGRISQHMKREEDGSFTSVCRRCLMVRDGRLEAFKKASNERPRAKRQPRPCYRCRRVVLITRQGRCGACSEYLRKRGAERPLPQPSLFSDSAA